MGRFDAYPLPSSCSDLVLGTSRTKYVDEGQVKGCVHSFNDHRSSIETFIEHWKFLIQLIIVKFSPNILIVPKVIPTSCNRLINKKISALNYALYNYIDSCALKLFIVSPSFRNVLQPNLFCKDTVHFSFHGNHVFTIILFNIIQYFKYRCCYYSPVINLI